MVSGGHGVLIKGYGDDLDGDGDDLNSIIKDNDYGHDEED